MLKKTSKNLDTNKCTKRKGRTKIITGETKIQIRINLEEIFICDPQKKKKERKENRQETVMSFTLFSSLD